MLLVDDVLIAASQPGPNGLKVKKQTLWRYQYDNHLGSAVIELDDTAGVISYEEFHPYGTSAYRLLSSAAEAPAKRYRFTGMERDEETGLSYHGERYLSCSLGRWIAPDPAGISDGVNRWSYSRLNPVRFKDSNGRAASPILTPVPLVPRAGAVVGAFIRWWLSPSRLEQRVADSIRREAQREARQRELLQRDPNTLTLDEAIQAGRFQTNDPTYGQDPFNQQFTMGALSVLSISALGHASATILPAMLQVSQGYMTVQAAAAGAGTPMLETAVYSKLASEPGESSLAGTAARSEPPPAPLIFAREYPARSLSDMIDIARRAGIEMHPEMKLIVDDKMVDALARRMGADPLLTDAAYAPQIRPGQMSHVGFQDLFVESGEEEFIPVYIRERTLSSTERFVATVAHESHELKGLEEAAPFGKRISAQKFQKTINARHDETPEVERKAVGRLRESGL